MSVYSRGTADVILQVGGTHHWNCHSATRCHLCFVAVVDVELQVADEMKVLGVVLDRRLTFEKQVMAVA